MIVGHPGWGESVFLREVWPDAKLVVFAEFFYRGRGLDIEFDAEFFATTDDSILRAKAKNAVMAMALAQADAIVTPTEFQASVLPPAFRPARR